MKSKPVPTNTKRIGLLIMSGLVLLFAGLVFWFGQVRPIDADEGFYASAAGLVSEGKAPYQDFFYPQSPLLPYVYGGMVKLGGQHLKALRLGSSMLTVLAVIPWLLFLADTKRWRLQVSIAAFSLLLLDPHLLSWNVTVKTFAFCNLAISWSLYFLCRGLQGRAWLWLGGAGLAAGLCLSTRALYAPMALALGVGLLVVTIRRGDRASWVGLAAFTLGGLAGAAPLLVAWLQNPDLFWFNNITCHQIRFSVLRSEGLGSAFWPRTSAALTVAAQALLLKPYRFMILVLAVIGWSSLIKPRANGNDVQPDFQIILMAAVGVFLLTNLLPDPVHFQYLTGTMGPLLLPGMVLGLGTISRRLPKVPILLIILLAAPLAWNALFVQKDGINPEHEWTWRSYERVCSLIEARTEPNDLVASFWPGYVFETGRQYLPGMENHFAIGVSEMLSPAEKRRYHIIGKELLADMFRARRPRAVVHGVWMNEIDTALDNDEMNALMDIYQDNYCFDVNEGRAKISLPCLKGNYGTLSN